MRQPPGAVLTAALLLLLAACGPGARGEPDGGSAPDASLVMWEQIPDSGPSPVDEVRLRDGEGLDRLLPPAAVRRLGPSAELPPLADDGERYAVIASGCQEPRAPELKVSDGQVRGEFPPEEDPVMCEAMEYYVAVFDVPAGEVEP